MKRVQKNTLIFLFCAVVACNKSNSNSNNGGGIPTPPVYANFSKGADVSWETQMEAAGRTFFNSSGMSQDCFQILKNLGMNSIRHPWKNLVMRIMIDSVRTIRQVL